ncbi:MAG: hypothetical protein JWO89_1916 [Verrucomicrobiaceae bacterium]|nr:hypothetical protein [Verrucomicrobiaceae bacterium]
MSFSPPSFLSPVSMSVDQVHQLLLLAIRDQQPDKDVPASESPCDPSYENKLSELAMKFFGVTPQRKCRC